MKVSELKAKLKEYDDEQLRTIMIAVYKQIPKAVRVGKGIDDIIEQGKAPVKPMVTKVLHFHELADEVDEFIGDARAQLYFAPNRKIPPKQRSNWRFLVKRLHRTLIQFVDQQEYAAQAAESFEKLYLLLCYSCQHHTFNTYDTFDTIKVSQAEFYDQVLTFNMTSMKQKQTYIKHAIELLIDNGLNRYTLYTELMAILIRHLNTVDLKEIAIAGCDKFIESTRSSLSKETDIWNQDYKKMEKVQNLATMGFMCYAASYEAQKGVIYFNINYFEENDEVKLYILLELLFVYGEVEIFCQTYDNALTHGVKPREGVVKTYTFVMENGKFPKYYS